MGAKPNKPNIIKPNPTITQRPGQPPIRFIDTPVKEIAVPKKK